VLRRADRAVETRVKAPAQPPIVVGDLEIDRTERRVRRSGVEVHLTPIEFELLTHLASRPRAVLPRERLLAQVWGWADASGPSGWSSHGRTRTVDSHVKALRRKLGADVIRTVHGVGYALEIAS
jgi:DNA-binding response OmpR family regulator